MIFNVIKGKYHIKKVNLNIPLIINYAKVN